jgi:hypothetical protein
MDDSGQFYLFRSQTNASVCTGLNFSKYAVDGTTIQRNTILTYDAVVLLAKALHVVISSGGDAYDNLAVYDALMNNVSFEGVSGLVEIFEGDSPLDATLKGERVTGLYFKNLEFSPEKYRAGDPNPFNLVGGWHSDSDDSMVCGVDFECSPIIFKNNGHMYDPPTDKPADIILARSPAAQGVLYAVGAIVFLLVLVLAAFTFKFEKTKQIKASQPIMLYCMLAGGVVAGCRVIVNAWTRTDAVCRLEIWLGHLAFIFVFGSLFVKTWRVHRLVNSKTLKKVVFTPHQAFRMFAGIVAMMCVYLMFTTLFGKTERFFQSSTVSNQTTKTPVCVTKRTQMETTLDVLEFIFLLFGFRLCYAIKDVPDSINESHLITKVL